MTGLARDGGLLLPETFPDVSDRLAAWSGLSYPELAREVMALYTDLPADALAELIDRSYAVFRTPEVTPVVPVGPIHVLELFHGPTLAFKDLALQWLGHLFAYILEQEAGVLNIVGATSGDTGSAAISGVRDKPRMRIFVMHPRGRISPIQERQMTTVLDDNVFNLAVEGTFDDCQGILKDLFKDLDFKDRYVLGAVNSINWARVLAQVVYYFHAALHVMRATGAGRVRFSVPTGNFGDIFAGYVAARMGLPIARLILATNENDILARFFREGEYRLGRVMPTLSPSMDIQVASNFERYLYYRVGEDPARLSALMEDFAATGTLHLDDGARAERDGRFAAGVGDTQATLDTIRMFADRYDYLLDPHSAVGVHVGLEHLDDDEPTICLATAHPAKFPDAVRRALGRDAAHHPVIDELQHLPTRCDTLDADPATVRRYIERRALHPESRNPQPNTRDQPRGTTIHDHETA